AIKNFKEFITGESELAYHQAQRQRDVSPIFDYQTLNFFYYDNPSTIAFDQCLNNLYFKTHYRDSQYTVGSTHYWKVNQRDKEGNFIPLRLSDKTELRVLHIALTDDHYPPIGENNILKVHASKDSDNLGESI